MTTRAPLVLTMMMKLPINRSKCIVLRPHSALLPRHRLFRIWSVFHITKYTSFFYVRPCFYKELQINQTSLQEWPILYFGYSPVSNVRFPVAHIQVPSVWCVCCSSVFSLQVNCIHLHVFVTSTVWQVVLSFPFPLPAIQVRISNNHLWSVGWVGVQTRPDQE